MRKRIVAIIMSLAMILGMGITCSAASTLVSAGKTGYCGAEGETPTETTALTDGDAESFAKVDKGSQTSWNWSGEGQYGHLAYFIVDLGENIAVDKVVISPIQPRNGELGSFFPQRFVIEASDTLDFADKTVLYDQSSEDYFENPNAWYEEGPKVSCGPTEPITFTVNGSGRYIRFRSLKNPAMYQGANAANGFVRTVLREIEVYGESASGDTGKDEGNKVISSGKTGYYGLEGIWENETSGLTDGNKTEEVYASAERQTSWNWSGEGEYGHLAYFKVDLGQSMKLSKITITPYKLPQYGNNFPQRFALDVSDTLDFAEYTVLYEQSTDLYENPNAWNAEGKKVSCGPTEPISIEVNGTGRYVRLRSLKNPATFNGENDANGYIRTIITEMEIEGGKADIITEKYELISKNKTGYVGKGGGTPTETTALTDEDTSTKAEISSGDTNWAGQNYDCAWFIVDLGEETEVQRVSAVPVAPPTYGSNFPQQFVIEISDTLDFANATTLYEQNTDLYENPNAWYAEGTKVSCGPTEPQVFDVAGMGRYVRFRSLKNPAYFNSATAAQGYEYTKLAELRIYKKVKAITINSEFVSNGNKAESASELSESVTITSTVNNILGNETEAVMIYALYNDFELVDVTTKAIKFSSETTLDPVTFNLEDGKTGYSVKVMMWDGMDKLTPLADYSELK